MSNHSSIAGTKPSSDSQNSRSDRTPKLKLASWIQKRRQRELSPTEALIVKAFRLILVFALLYLFLLSIGLMGAGFKVFGKDFARALIETTNNPFVGLFVGVLATALIQSSSTTTSMVVAFVAAGTITVQNAVPVIMGANIGTAVTSTLVSMGHVTRRREFERAFAAGTVHDFFNLMAVIVFLPLELTTRFFSRAASKLAEALAGSSGVEFRSPLKLITKPVCQSISTEISSFGFTTLVTGIIIVVMGCILLIASLIILSRLLKLLFLGKMQQFFQDSIYSNGYFAILIGIVLTVMVQSSSVTTSLMIPMAAANIILLEQVFPVALGANVGTTITALLASMATGSKEALTIAFVHLIFNLCGIAVFFPLKVMRQLPIKSARILSGYVTKNRIYGPLFVLIVYFLVPGLAILIT